MIQAGILTENDDVELLEGLILKKMARNPPHDVGVEVARDALGRNLPQGWSLRGQSAITTADSEPEPDVAVVRGEPRAYRLQHPEPADIGVLVEVSDSTLAYDRSEKGRVYAHAGIGYYWIINLVDGWIEVYTDPDATGAAPAYRTRTDYRPGDSIPLMLDGKMAALLAVADLLP
jgi:Uma2 family endonuclease